MSTEPGGPDWVQGENGKWFPPQEAPEPQAPETMAPDPEGKRSGFVRWWLVLMAVVFVLIGLLLLFLFLVENDEGDRVPDAPEALVTVLQGS